MKATGMVRRMDNLGRVVIPKEIRQAMNIHVNEKLEIYTDNGGEIIFKKFTPAGNFEDLAEHFSASVTRACGIIMAVIEADTVIACSPAISKDEMVGRAVSNETERIISRSKLYQWHENEEAVPLTERRRDKYFIKALMPAVSRGNLIGAAAALCLDTLTEPTESEVNLLRTAAVLFSEYMEVVR
jgi:AbrB family transcriptional regulator (stage V sporulation protein T)